MQEGAQNYLQLHKRYITEPVSISTIYLIPM
uniref:Uncharacterized protein n=1 Tax=Arundo donax TaxID=35708 RepID=A0A0A8YTH0_ARUDO